MRTFWEAFRELQQADFEPVEDSVEEEAIQGFPIPVKGILGLSIKLIGKNSWFW
jgi:hypothetical protein